MTLKKALEWKINTETLMLYRRIMVQFNNSVKVNDWLCQVGDIVQQQALLTGLFNREDTQKLVFVLVEPQRVYICTYNVSPLLNR